MLQTYRKRRILAQRRYFDRWRMQQKCGEVYEKFATMIGQYLDKKKIESDKVANEMKNKKEELSKASSQHKELHERCRAIKKKIVEAEEALAQQTARSRITASEKSLPSNEAEASNIQDQNQLKELEDTYEALLSENKVLKTNIQACEANLQNFVNEMNSLLDQHEIGSVVGQALMPSDIDFQNVGG